MTRKTSDIHVREFLKLTSPAEMISAISMPEDIKQQVATHREGVRRLLRGEDKRLLVIVGPCSIHDPKAALDYAEQLSALRTELSQQIEIIMRVYFEKPRTTVGWKGLINDPKLDGSYDINLGLRTSRQVLLDICQLGLPTATEFLDPITPQYLSDLVSWAAIGARTTESQIHREMVSGLSMPVGFKNSTEGNIDTAINAMISAGAPQSFLGIDSNGVTSIVKTSGNDDVHLVLRGGKSGPNYSPEAINLAEQYLHQFNHSRLICIDCSHDNCFKDYSKQPKVFNSVVSQVKAGNRNILGVMLESNLVAGKQKLGPNLTYGQSITDGCIDFKTTSSMLRLAAESLSS